MSGASRTVQPPGDQPQRDPRCGRASAGGEFAPEGEWSEIRQDSWVLVSAGMRLLVKSKVPALTNGKASAARPWVNQAIWS